jgi:hypothetical protein
VCTGTFFFRVARFDSLVERGRRERGEVADEV